ncbi:MAG: radical SAM protein [Elusimicrobia bacterium]|nr:radical SAM protein [Elusimicrobiota bacterium]
MRHPYAYEHGNNLYVNLTSLCPTDCVFCPKRESGRRFRGHDLSLDGEPELDEIWADVLERAARRSYSEFVFCGYGESTYRLDAITQLSERMKKFFPRSGRRLNTIGLGSMIWGRDIVPELAESLTNVSVSLNTADPRQWRRLHRPRPEMRAGGFEGALEFVRSCVLSDLRATVTAVELPGVDLPAVERLARSLGAEFAVRPRLTAAETS